MDDRLDSINVNSHTPVEEKEAYDLIIKYGKTEAIKKANEQVNLYTEEMNKVNRYDNYLEESKSYWLIVLNAIKNLYDIDNIIKHRHYLMERITTEVNTTLEKRKKVGRKFISDSEVSEIIGNVIKEYFNNGYE